MRDLVRSEAAGSERQRTLTPAIVDEMWASGLMSSFNPIPAGGVEPSFPEMIETWIEMAWQDGSFGWIGIANLPSTFAAGAYLPDEGFAEVFTAHDNRIATGGQFFPNGQGHTVDGGYRLSGSWSFGSGTGHSEYIAAGFMPMDDGEVRWISEGLPDMQVAIVPLSSGVGLAPQAVPNAEAMLQVVTSPELERLRTLVARGNVARQYVTANPDNGGARPFLAYGTLVRTQAGELGLYYLFPLDDEVQHAELVATRTQHITGLPVAGFSGTLAPGQSVFGNFGPAALGTVQAKTGNLTRVVSLAGIVSDASGRLLAFAFMADRLPGGQLVHAAGVIDAMATALAGCGCRS